MIVQDSDRLEIDSGRRLRRGRDEAPAGLRWCLHAVAGLALTVAVGQVFAPLVVSGGTAMFAYLFSPMTYAALLVVGVILRYVPLADAVGARARRDLARMMGAFALTADVQMRWALAWSPAKDGLLEGLWQHEVVGLLVVLGMVLIRHVAYGRARYVMAILITLPLLLSANVDKVFYQLSVVSLVTPLLLYAGCMLYAQSIGLDIQRPRSPRSRTRLTHDPDRTQPPQG